MKQFKNLKIKTSSPVILSIVKRSEESLYGFVIMLLFAVLFSLPASAQDIFIEKEGKISFYSEAPLEDIEAETNKAVSALNVKTKKVFFKIPVASFEFDNKLMQEHFNENYLETEKFPYATFKGEIKEDIDLTVEGEYKVTIAGTLTIHGVEQQREIKGTLKVSDDDIKGESEFYVKLADHDVEIPSILIKNIAEEVLVKVKLKYEPKEK